jgi:hypothetical protein
MFDPRSTSDCTRGLGDGVQPKQHDRRPFISCAAGARSFLSVDWLTGELRRYQGMPIPDTRLSRLPGRFWKRIAALAGKTGSPTGGSRAGAQAPHAASTRPASMHERPLKGRPALRSCAERRRRAGSFFRVSNNAHEGLPAPRRSRPKSCVRISLPRRQSSSAISVHRPDPQ